MRLPRSITLRLCGDWGLANMHRICGWLAMETCARAKQPSRSEIHSGTGCVDNLRRVARGDVDVAVVTPAAFARLAARGQGPHIDEPLPHLRALGTIPHRDALLFAVNGGRGIESIAAWKEQRAPLRIGTCRDDGISHVGYAAAQLLTALGVPPALVEEWGGSFVFAEPYELPSLLGSMARGELDAVIHEAIMTPAWHSFNGPAPPEYLSIDDAALERLEQQLGWSAIEIEPGYLPHQREPVRTLDFSDFLLTTTEDLPDDVAALIAWCLLHASDRFQSGYRHLDPGRSPVTLPLEARLLASSAIEMHPAAQAVYADQLRAGADR